ncbi:helix-turn-helix transcriptional regulator [Undibacterium fentianense]|uniref:YafY family transcriptional regulator n=1 Tax=Undibacterium fentianense TaxID=2828728 RepID=A0A941E8C8_9BURK|nr:YafY family protein [Undibacterium fentianense]MBR7800528.1 YafY family transcriptional regulator [Undibacterium fentianense]
MSRTKRLLDLLQILRNHRFPVTGENLARELHISIRTLYRDIASLQEQGASIIGEPGLGYVLKPGFMLPPLMFSEEEIEALVLGSRWVAERADQHLGLAARQALQKIAAVLPADLRHLLDTTPLLAGPDPHSSDFDTALPLIRATIRSEHKLQLAYRDGQGKSSRRMVWPFALGYFEHVRILIAWCELRQEIRHFRTDRITSFEVYPLRYPKRRQALLKEWKMQEGITTDKF